MEDSRQQQHKPVTGYPAAQPSYPTGPTTTAYAYPTPPPYPNPYPAHPPPPPYDLRRATFLRRLIAAVIAVILITGTFSFIYYLIFRPRLPEFSVSSAAVSPFNLSSSSSQLTANWNIGISVRNPNKKMSIDYDSIRASVVYASDALAETTLPPFYQGKGNLTTITARFAAVSDYVDEGTLKGLSDDRARGAVEFRLTLFASVRFRAGKWPRRRRLMRVWCRHVRIGFSSVTGPGSLSGAAPRECDVYL